MSAHEGSHSVVVNDFAFTPETLQIDPGETVAWDVQEDGHTITADGLFDFTVSTGDQVQWTFDEPGTYSYYCKRHADMRGTIQVGSPELPCVDCPSETRVVPSEAFPTLGVAVATAPPRTLIAILPGTYDVSSTIEMAAPGLAIRGVDTDGQPAAEGEVVLRGKAGTTTGIRMVAGADSRSMPARVENITLTRFLDTGLEIAGVSGFRVEAVRAVDNVEHGISAVAATRGVISDSYASGHRRAGISIHMCESCDVRLENLTARNNFVGLLADNAGSLVVRSSTISDNASGIVLRSVSARSPHLQQGAHIFGNEVRNNVNHEAPRPSIFATTEAMELPTGAGIWVQGGWHDVIQQNAVSGNHYGIVITSSTAPSNQTRVIDNVVTTNTVDLGWDGVGAGSCFSGNIPGVPTAGEAPAMVSSEPAQIQTLYPCGSNSTVGVPYPKVTADLASYAFFYYHCHDIDGRFCR